MDKQSILLVEDNPDDVELTLRALKSHRIVNEITVARDGAQALALLFSPTPSGVLPELPSLVLLDLKLPKIDGLEVLQKIRSDARTKHLPVVILTTSREERDVFACYGLGANSYVQKPVDYREFEEAIQNLGLYWLLLNVAPTVR